MVSQRLSAVDCQFLRPGQVFCWEQDNGEGGIERWTDGRKWQVKHISLMSSSYSPGKMQELISSQGQLFALHREWSSAPKEQGWDSLKPVSFFSSV
jgi:hypothetical protein